MSVLLIGLGCVALLLGGSLLYPGFLKPSYILQQLQIAAFLGIIATGAMLVILLGEIDLSVPWTITGTAIVVISATGSSNPVIASLAIPLGLCFGMVIGLLNAIGVAIFRVPAMVWTLAVNAMLLGATVFYTGNSRPNGEVPWLATQAAIGRTFGIPNAFLVWLGVAVITVWVLRRTVYGNYLYALGNSRRAVFLAGARVRLVTVATFVLAGAFSSFGAILLLGYTNQAYQGMGDPYLMPVISAVVVGGTSIQGGRGNYVGTFAGAIFITLLSSILSVMQMPAAAREMIFGAIILVMLLIHGLTGKNKDI
ncbi:MULTISPECIES: ABC transporter permease [unclassified Mesorhizobium]|uniref:ABC transporter permease n=1 Tax=unclassified Mesorhizobium TaxID=325217 RepID=UPI0019365484|nr:MULTISPECIES: ABC transporter permease [unclassified Mesorhizobium]BCG85651.1 ABC transporter permease [Mesorhizobium sp. 113-3-9]